MRTLHLLAMGLTFSTATLATELVHEAVVYHDDDTVLEGVFVYDAARPTPQPTVIIFHAWGGPGAYELRRAEQLAELGYVAFVADIYGQGIRPETPAERAVEAGRYRTDRALARSRAFAALQTVKDLERVDNNRVAAIGYCFGGLIALELARSGAALNGVVSFHGNLATPYPDDAHHIKSRVLVLHGADDPHVPDDEVLAFKNEMRAAKVDWQFIAYGGAVHSFTNPDAGDDPSRGAAYHAPSDARSWKAMQQFFDELFL